MGQLAIHLNDADVTVFDGQKVVYREPGFAYLGNESLSTGIDAYSNARIDPRRVQNRFWSDLNTKPFSDHRFAHLSAADLASKQLEEIWTVVGDDVSGLVVAVPGYMSSENLGLFLGIAREIGLPVSALVDSAVAATRREYGGAVPVHIDLSLHRATLTRLAQPGMVQVDRTEVIDDVGLGVLSDIWLKTIAETFVQQSRFDPLHKAETEQMLLTHLSAWIDSASRHGKVEMEMQSGEITYRAEIEALALIGAAAPAYQQIASRLRALFRAEDVPAIQVTDRVARLPGLVDMLEARVGGEVFVLEPGATARGALARLRKHAGDSAAVSLLRQLPWDQAGIDVTQQSSENNATGMPTHLLFGHQGYEIGNLALVIGSQESAGERFLELDTDMPGVSRRHCSILQKNGQCVLEDHSRYGTFLNGHRVDGSSILQVGDAIRIGTPGYELQLITTKEVHG
ncbi:MAG: FHA domain-containing protein [Woeseiaceae bacterium]|nr:FHA domain-containing protein [Woeseiaceae bacterium]